MDVHQIPGGRRSPRLPLLVGFLLLLLLASRSIAHYVIEYQWWKEMGQLSTWFNVLLYGFLPVVTAGVLTFAALWIAHARGLKFAGTSLREHRTYARVSLIPLALLAIIVAGVTIDSWTIVRWVGARGLPSGAQAWHDPIFGRSLAFYIFELPFYKALIRYVFFTAAAAALVAWGATRFWSLRRLFPDFRSQTIELDLRDFRPSSGAESRLLHLLAAILLLALAASFFFDRYELFQSDHGFIYGIDYVDEHVRVPGLWAATLACIVSAGLLLMGRVRLAVMAVVSVVALSAVAAGVLGAVYVRPNELSLQRPYIVKHIAVTRAAYGFDSRLRELQFPARLEARIDLPHHQATLENVRLWDWRAFHDTITQIQALRQYYVFHDTDVDRYMLDGRLRQVMLTPRELDISQLGSSAQNWINSHFIYTHSYGIVMAEANRITESGAPVLIVQDAPPEVKTASLRLTRPELYYSEVGHEPVFVHTQQPEFNYPSGSENVQTRYEGKGGIPVGSFPIRLAAAFAEGDWKILLTGYLRGESRMLIRRNVRERVETLAGFLRWDSDPYLVVTAEGRLVWMFDGYTTTTQHPYSRPVRLGNLGTFNYIRNSVKATIDAYDGSVHLYVFDPDDPIIRAWQNILPALFRPASEMPADLRAHARFPEGLFRAQAETYRTFHMTDPEAFYNKEDLWDVGKFVATQGAQPEPLPPTYVVASLPGEDTPEFLLMLPFTPRNKDNMIGLMMARCDGDKLGEIVVLQLSKQSLIYGPLQVASRIDSDQTISKDLSLWNQQGSQVLRGQMIVLPVQDTFLYVVPIYIQAAQAKMPQLKKVALAMGNKVIYRDTYDQALADLGGLPGPAPQPVTTAAAGTPTAGAAQAQPPPAGPPPAERRVETIRDHLKRYRDLAAQGKWSEAGRELEAIESIVNQNR